MDLKTYRTNKHLSQAKVAEALGISQIRVSEIERGQHPSGGLAARIVDWTGGAVGFDDLFKPRTEAA